LRIIFTDIVSIFLETLSYYFILIFLKKERNCFARNFALAVFFKDSSEEFVFH